MGFCILFQLKNTDQERTREEKCPYKVDRREIRTEDMQQYFDESIWGWEGINALIELQPARFFYVMHAWGKLVEGKGTCFLCRLEALT